jgi:hypothetical protein
MQTHLELILNRRWPWTSFEQSGLSAATVWRYRGAGCLNTLNISGRHYLTRAEIARFNTRAVAGEFAKEPARPKGREHN